MATSSTDTILSTASNTAPNFGGDGKLTTDFSALRTAINNLSADGNTNIPIGMSWGWNTLTSWAPFSDGVPYGTAKHKKIIVLMTDGENTTGPDLKEFRQRQGAASAARVSFVVDGGGDCDVAAPEVSAIASASAIAPRTPWRLIAHPPSASLRVAKRSSRPSR